MFEVENRRCFFNDKVSTWNGTRLRQTPFRGMNGKITCLDVHNIWIPWERREERVHQSTIKQNVLTRPILPQRACHIRKRRK